MFACEERVDFDCVFGAGFFEPLSPPLYFMALFDNLDPNLIKMEIIIKRKANRVGDRKRPVHNIRQRYDRRVPEFDFMKYWRAIRYWACRKYNLKTGDLDMLFFLYSEMYFDKEKFEEFNNLLPWNRNRLREMMDAGWIHVWRGKEHHQRELYEVSAKTRGAITLIYKKINRQEISESRKTSPMWYTNVGYADKVYRNFIKKMNIQIRQEQYHARERQKELSRQQ
jgi:hypothetical protein